MEGYSIVCFDCFASVKGGAHTCFVDAWILYEAHMSPTLYESSAIQRFEGSDVIEIRDGITFNFYTELSHIYPFCFILWLQNLFDRNHFYVQFSFCQTLHVYSVACMSYAITVLTEMLQRTWLWQFSFKSNLKKVWYTILHYNVVKLAVSIITSQVWHRGIAKMMRQ